MATSKKTLLLLLLAFCCGCSGRHDVSSPQEQREYEQDRDKVVSLNAALSAGEPGELKPVQELGDSLDKKWARRNREYHARLMLEVCKPLTSGRVNDDRRQDVARRYALSALDEPDMVPLTLELELVGHVVTLIGSSVTPSTHGFAKQRKEDVAIWLHAWRRLMNAIDPTWDPDEVIMSPNSIVPPGEFQVGGVDPKAIKDPKLRAEYESRIQRNQEKGQRHSDQRKLRMWLKVYPERAEEYITSAYSQPPFNLKELRQVLGAYLTVKATKTRILDAVGKIVAAQTKDESNTVERTP